MILIFRRFCLLLFAALMPLLWSQNSDWARYVNPMVGTDGTGHTYPGATVPHGMVQLSPDTRIDGSWEGCSGYHYMDNVIYGFSHTHLSGTGASDYGDIMLMPGMGQVSLKPEDYSSQFSHSQEKASAGYYEVLLQKHNILARLTTSTRVGFHEYTFNQAGDAHIVLDLNHRDELLEGEVLAVSDRVFHVKRRSSSWAKNQYVFARIEFEEPVYISHVQNNGRRTANIYQGTQLTMAFSRNVKAGEKIKIKVALSFTGHQGADLNRRELLHWDFEQTKKDAYDLWNKELSAIQILDSNREGDKTVFYTALYHTKTQPNIAQDLDGKYRGMDMKIHTAEGFEYYTVFSLWDTFRATHPLYTLIDKKRTADYINTFLMHYEQGGRLPVWELASNETDCMIGYHAVSVIADAMLKGIQGFDYEKAYQASKASAMLDHFGLDAYKKQGFININDENESVSKTLEYAYNDWCIAQMANYLGHTNDFEYFSQRAQNWKNLFHTPSAFIRPKTNNGWLTTFDPHEVNNYYTEANGWQYHFHVLHQIPEFIEWHGGKSAFEKKLDQFFESDAPLTGRHQVDITGLMGQYAHGNEPSHHVAYMYNFVDKPEKTQTIVHSILRDFYTPEPDGLVGNEDCGQMSAWYILSAMGIYSVTPGKPEWETTKPYFNHIRVNFENGDSKTITANSTHKQLRKFGFENVAHKDWAYPQTSVVPVIEPVVASFYDDIEVSLQSAKSKQNLFYSTDGQNFQAYTEPVKFSETTNLHFYSQDQQVQSPILHSQFLKNTKTYTILHSTPTHSEYHGGSENALIDGIYGTENWRIGNWQGFQGADLEMVLDLEQIKSLKSLEIRFLQDTRAWIVLPKQLEVWTSLDGKNYKSIGTTQPKKPVDNLDIFIENFQILTEKAEKTRFIKIKATNFGTLPAWHISAAENAYIFVDEIDFEWE